jgi:hypothetical protein
VNGRLEISNDGKTFRPVKAVAARPPALELTFDAQTARFFRISFTSYVTPRTIDVSDFQLSPRYQVPDYLAKASFVTAQAPPARAEFAAVPAEFIIHRDHIVDLTRRMDAAGKLTWEVPPGNWTILRFGHTTTGVKNHPAPESGLASISTRNNSVNAIGVFAHGVRIQANLMVRFLPPNQGIDVG